MSDARFEDFVAIDTNVFLHLLNPQNNVDSHINRLLSYLQQQGIALLVDDGGRIAAEYSHQLGERMRNADDRLNEIQLLRYWMDPAYRKGIPVAGTDSLMMAIKNVIHEQPEAVDRRFVYVAFKAGKTLITNDIRHIVCGAPSESTPRRDRLLGDTRKLRPDGAAIITSLEADTLIGQCPKQP